MTTSEERRLAKQRAELDKIAEGLMTAVRDKFDDAIAVFPKMAGTIVCNRGVLISAKDAERLLKHLTERAKS